MISELITQFYLIIKIKFKQLQKIRNYEENIGKKYVVKKMSKFEYFL